MNSLSFILNFGSYEFVKIKLIEKYNKELITESSK
jgi:hypothetical protein